MDYNSYYLNQLSSPHNNFTHKKKYGLGSRPKKNYTLNHNQELTNQNQEEEITAIKLEVNTPSAVIENIPTPEVKAIKRPAEHKKYVILKKRQKPDIFNS